MTMYYLLQTIERRLDNINVQVIVQGAKICLFANPQIHLCYPITHTGCPIMNDTLTLSHNFRINYPNPKFEAGM